MPEEDLVEIFRSQDQGAVEHVITVLNDAGITHHLTTDEGGFDLTSIGSGDDSEKFLNIGASDYEAARKALEIDSLKTDLPADHHLLHSSEDELIDVFTHASEWSAFDTAHARKLLEERGVDISKLEEDRAKRIAQLKQGKPASKNLIFLGWIFSVLGGFIGITIGYSLKCTKIKTPEGEFLKYDEPSRDTGAKIFNLGILVAALVLIIRLVI